MGPDLLPSERVLWTGKPARFPLLDRGAVLLVPFGLVWLGFVVLFWVRASPQGVMRLAVPVVLVLGLGSVLWQTFHPRLVLTSAEYTVTDQRVITTSRVLGRYREQSAYLTDLPPATLFERDGGVGTIRFGDSGSLADLFPSRKDGESRPPFALREIENAREVRDTIANARAAR